MPANVQLVSDKHHTAPQSVLLLYTMHVLRCKVLPVLLANVAGPQHMHSQALRRTVTALSCVPPLLLPHLLRASLLPCKELETLSSAGCGPSQPPKAGLVMQGQPAAHPRVLRATPPSRCLALTTARGATTTPDTRRANHEAPYVCIWRSVSCYCGASRPLLSSHSGPISMGLDEHRGPGIC